MKQTRLIMGMPVTIEIIDDAVTNEIFSHVFDYFTYVDNTFSMYKDSSEITKINRNNISKKNWSGDMKTIFKLCQNTKKDTNGYFESNRNGIFDPTGLVKGWAIYNAAKIIEKKGFRNFYVDAGGDIQVSGKNSQGNGWRVGIRNPFNRFEIVKTVALYNCGIATSGTAIRGQHVYNPHNLDSPITDIISISVISDTVFDADRFATAAFAMGKKGIEFIEQLPGYEGYMIDTDKQATYTSGFNNYVIES